VALDESTLVGQGPVRILVMCPNPARLDFTLPPFFFGKAGRTLVVELERDKGQSGPKSPSPSPSDLHRGEATEDEGESSREDLGDEPADDGGPGGQPAVPVAPPTSEVPPGGPSAISSATRLPASARPHSSAPAKLAPVDVPRHLRIDPVDTLGLPLEQYGSNLCVSPGPPDFSGLAPSSRDLCPSAGVTASPRSSGEVETVTSSMGMQVCPPSSPRSPGVVCYYRSPGTPPAGS
jgi:hypothetical protein